MSVLRRTTGGGVFESFGQSELHCQRSHSGKLLRHESRLGMAICQNSTGSVRIGQHRSLSKGRFRAHCGAKPYIGSAVNRSFIMYEDTGHSTGRGLVRPRFRDTRLAGGVFEALGYQGSNCHRHSGKLQRQVVSTRHG